jgi:hypothetical protein
MSSTRRFPSRVSDTAVERPSFGSGARLLSLRSSSVFRRFVIPPLVMTSAALSSVGLIR